MLLKVDDGNNGWVLFDSVDKVHLTAKTHEVSRATELREIGGEEASILIPKDSFRNGSTVQVGVLEFERKETHRKVLFTNIAYVCDDRGNTIDKLSVKHGKGK